MARNIRRLRDGRLRIRIGEHERELLRSLAERMRPVLAGEHDAAGAHRRLFPNAHEDPELEAEYRELVGDDLAGERLESLEAFTATLSGGQVRRGIWYAELRASEADAWLSAINDFRLTLGVLLGITSESEWETGPEPDNPTSVALFYLGWLQEQLVEALMGGLPDEWRGVR